eukprot:scaffold1861_cov111-Isochrysis_galbana.AAC.9
MSLRARRSPVPAPEPRSVPPPPGALDTRERELVSVEGDASSPSDGAGEAVPCGPEGGGRGCGLNATPGTLCVSPGAVPRDTARSTGPLCHRQTLARHLAMGQHAPAPGVDDHGGGEEDQHDPGGHSGKGVLNARDGARRAVRVDRHLRIRRGRDVGGGSEGFVGDRRVRADTDGRGSWGSGESVKGCWEPRRGWCRGEVFMGVAAKASVRRWLRTPGWAEVRRDNGWHRMGGRRCG